MGGVHVQGLPFLYQVRYHGGGVCVYKAYLMYTMSGEQGGLSMTSQSKTSQGSPPRD